MARKRRARKPKAGSGERFKALVRKLRGKVKDPKAVAASIGRKKYGRKRFAEMAAKGRKRAAKKRAGRRKKK